MTKSSRSRSGSIARRSKRFPTSGLKICNAAPLQHNLSVEEIRSLKTALDEKLYRVGTRDFNRTFYRLRMIVLIALTTGMRMAEISGLTWGDVRYTEGLIAVRSKLKGGKIRYVPTPELAAELGKYPITDLRHTFASCYMMNGGDLYELAKILGHSNIKMTDDTPSWERRISRGPETRRARCGN